MKIKYMTLLNIIYKLLIHFTFFKIFSIELLIFILYTNNEIVESIIKYESEYQ